MKNFKNEDAFIKELMKNFPEIATEILDEDYKGLFTLQIGCFKRFTQNAIDKNDFVVLKRCFEFVTVNFSRVEHKIENALLISYLNKLNFQGHSEAEKLLPGVFKKMLDEINLYYISSSHHSKLDKF